MKYQISIDQTVSNDEEFFIKKTAKFLKETETESLSVAEQSYEVAKAAVAAFENVNDDVIVFTVELLEQSRGDGWYPIRIKTIIK